MVCGIVFSNYYNEQCVVLIAHACAVLSHVFAQQQKRNFLSAEPLCIRCLHQSEPTLWQFFFHSNLTNLLEFIYLKLKNILFANILFFKHIF